MELSEEERESAQKYRAILNHYGCIDIARYLSDEAIYDLMFTINWTGSRSPFENDYSNYYYKYREVENDSNKLNEFKESFINRTKQLLKKRGYNEKEIEEKIAEGFAEKIMNLYCWPGGLQLMFRDYFGPGEVLEKYIKELEEDEKKFTTSQIGKTTLHASAQAKKEAEEAENLGHEDNKENQGEEFGDDN